MATTRKPTEPVDITLTVAHDANHRNVVIDLGQQTARLIMTPEEAIALAATIYTQARRIATKPLTVTL